MKKVRRRIDMIRKQTGLYLLGRPVRNGDVVWFSNGRCPRHGRDTHAF